MEIRRASRSGLFLLELMLVILFFSLTSAICAHLFVQAHLVSGASSALTGSAREVQSVAEQYKAAGGDLTRLSQRANLSEKEGMITFSYGRDWEKSDGENTAYSITVLPAGKTLTLPDGSDLTSEESGYAGCKTARIVAWNEKGVLFQICVGVFSPEKAEEKGGAR